MAQLTYNDPYRQYVQGRLSQPAPNWSLEDKLHIAKNATVDGRNSFAGIEKPEPGPYRRDGYKTRFGCSEVSQIQRGSTSLMGLNVWNAHNEALIPALHYNKPQRNVQEVSTPIGIIGLPGHVPDRSYTPLVHDLQFATAPEASTRLQTPRTRYFDGPLEPFV